MDNKSFVRRLALNSQISKNLYWELRVLDKGYENFVPVGRGVPSSPNCAKYVGIRTCEDVEAHKGKFLGCRDATGMAVVKHMHWWCHRPLCPRCFIRGWATREARSIESRLEEGTRRGYGKVEHIVVSFNSDDACLDWKVLRKKACLALKDRGVIGNCTVFHGYSMNRERTFLVWHPHYHALGYVEGDGFDRCRWCVHVREDCSVCDGFKGKEVRGFKKDGILVRVLSARKKSYYGDKPNVFGTAFYQLHHSTVKIGIGRFHVVVWNGNVSNKQFKTPKAVFDVKCPVCKESMHKARYEDKSRPFVEDVGDPNYESISLRPLVQSNGEATFSHLDV